MPVYKVLWPFLCQGNVVKGGDEVDLSRRQAKWLWCSGFLDPAVIKPPVLLSMDQEKAA